MVYDIVIKKDWEGFLASVVGYDNLYARWVSEKQAESELMNVIDMMMDFYMERAEQQRSIRNFLLSRWVHYAV